MAEETNPANPDEARTQGEAGEKQPAAKEEAPKAEAAKEASPKADQLLNVPRQRRRQSRRRNSQRLQQELLKIFPSLPMRLTSRRSSKPKAARMFIQVLRMCSPRSTTRSSRSLTERQRDRMVECRQGWLQRFAQKHCLCCPNGGSGRLAPGNGPWTQRSGSIGQRTGSRTRIRRARFAGDRARPHSDSRRYARAAQWLSSAKAAPRLIMPLQRFNDLTI